MDINVEVERLLANHNGFPLKAFWEVLQTASSSESLQVAMAVVNHPSCGIERKATEVDGYFRSTQSLSVSRGATPLMLATVANRSDVVLALVAAGANVRARESIFEMTSLHWACSDANANSTIVSALLVESINMKDYSGQTALHKAAYFGQTTVIDLLLAGGASSTVTDNGGGTPLHWAVERSKPQAAAAILAAEGGGACLDVATYGRETALHCAARQKCAELTQMLLESGATVSARTGKGETPLHLAAERGFTTNIELLLACGADVEATNDRFASAAALATKHKHNEPLLLLKANGADCDFFFASMDSDSDSENCF